MLEILKTEATYTMEGWISRTGCVITIMSLAFHLSGQFLNRFALKTATHPAHMVLGEKGQLKSTSRIKKYGENKKIIFQIKSWEWQ